MTCRVRRQFDGQTCHERSRSAFTWVPDTTLGLSQQVLPPAEPSHQKDIFSLKNWEGKPTKR